MVRHFMINGVKVVFPFDPYPSQMAMMTKIIQGLKRGQSCLLESPTGSGKSLALLCASLAWQRAEIERIDAHNRLVDAQQRDHRPPDDGGCLDTAISMSGAPQFTTRNTVTDNPITSPVKPTSPADQLKTDPNTSTGWYDDELDDFRCGTGDESRKSRVSMTTTPSASLNASCSSDAVEDPGRLKCATDTDMTEFNQPSLNKRIKKPKIYFGTRTHKQIAQIVRELRRTEYRNAKMTVLASREHTCIHPQVSRSANKNEGCRELLDPANPELNCAFHSRANQRLRSQDHLQLEGIVDAWDLEDLVQLGRRIRACPFYSARNLKDDADVVFCPYNYLIEPGIRESLDIQLRGQVLILDEAHNIEDSCREAASFSVQLPQLQEAIRDLEKCGTGVRKTRAECLDMARMLSHVCRWMEQQSGSMEDQRAFDRACTVYTGTDMVAHLTQMGVSPHDFPELYKMYAAISSEDSDSGGDAAATSEYVNRVVTSTMSILGSLFRELGFIYGGEMKHRDDFRVSLSRTMSRVKTSAAQPDTGEGWLSSRRRRGGGGRGSQQLVWVLSLEFICLNPAVVFAPLGEMAHGIIVASGTLSPMSSFQSELGVSFPLQLEASHVIDMDQVFVAALCSGPRGGSLNATYRNSEQLSFQDELGEAVMGVCGVVPNGVLCFLPSYSMLDKLAKRWRVTGLWEQLDNVKPVLCEPRAGSEFAEVMQVFIGLTSSPRGAIMLAVCRGKLSEGIDFADNSARAVITVGIPYPNVKDEKVELKKQYNNINSRRGLLRGGEWYGVQAYRALNQALGRCIRHRYDWGAILLVDDRFSQPRGTDGLSRWVRSVVRHHRHFPTATQQLHEFVERMQRRDANTAQTVAAACCEDAKQPGEKEHFPVITLLDSPPLSADSATPAPSIGSSLAPQPNDSPLDVSSSAMAARRRRDAIAVKRSRFFHLAGNETAPAQTGGVGSPIGRQVAAPAIQLSPDLFVDDDVLMLPAELPGAGNSNFGTASKSAPSSSSQLTNSPPIIRRLSRHLPSDRGLAKGKRGIVFSSDEEG